MQLDGFLGAGESAGKAGERHGYFISWVNCLNKQEYHGIPRSLSSLIMPDYYP